jgi:hypothetical protein
MKRLKASLPVKEGQKLSFDAMPHLIAQIQTSIKQLTGKEATDVAPVCCTGQHNWIVYIGLPGKNVQTFRYNSTPQGRRQFPPEIVSLYREAMNLIFESLQKPGAETSEDRSQGYALSAYPPLRAKQLAMRDYAVHHESLIRQILQESGESEQRAIAAHLLGYANYSQQQITDLVHASHDPDDSVRNNAVRALGVLAGSKPTIASEIPASDFISMLNSGIWKDRNKGGFLLSILTTNRDQQLLNLLRQQASDSLLEMVHWDAGHADDSLVILGRIARIDENRLQQLVASHDRDTIIREFLRNRAQ